MALCVHSFIQFHAAVVVKHREKSVSSLPPAACILCIVLCNVVSTWKLCSFQVWIGRDVERKASVLIWSLFRPAVWDFMTSTDSVIKDSIIIFNYALQPLMFIARSNFRHQVSPRVSLRESTQRRKMKLWARNVRKFCLNADIHVIFSDLLHAVKLRHGIYGFTSPPKEGVLRIFSP
jgi:hypothetical protein